MERIKRNFPVPDTFKRCQLCGHTSKYDDICEFRMLIECDENDKPEPGNVLIRCQQEACVKAIADHPRLYVDVPWGRGAPGHFILVCGDCTFRNQWRCTHPDLKANGGKGLEVFLSNGRDVRVCFNDGTSSNSVFPTPVVECSGKNERE